MALEAPLRSSTGSIASRYLTHADMSFSAGPESPALPSQYMAYDSHSSSPHWRILTVVLLSQLLLDPRLPIPPAQFVHETELGAPDEPEQ
jgi:hypothetical protein